MAINNDITIIGGGIAGLTLAILLGQIEIDVHLVEPRPPGPLKGTRPTSRTIALMESSLNIIKAANIWDQIEQYANPLQAMRIIDDSKPGATIIDKEFPAQEIDMEQFGFNIPNAILRAALYETAQNTPNITLHTADSLSNYETSKQNTQITLESGTKITSKLIIGADGRNSLVRKTAGIKEQNKIYDQSAITCLINHSQSHNNTATEFHRPSGPLAFVPLPGNQCSVVWVEKTEQAKTLTALKKNEFIQALQDRSNNILGGITLEDGPECWPLSSIKAKSLTAERTALIAEAAHVMSPITAQGLNLSLRDVAALAETIADAIRLGLDPGTQTILNKYGRRRRIDVNTRVFGVDGMNQIVSNNTGTIKSLRRQGLKTATALPPLKRFAMQTGLAPQIDQGRLAKGQKL